MSTTPKFVMKNAEATRTIIHIELVLVKDLARLTIEKVFTHSQFPRLNSHTAETVYIDSKTEGILRGRNPDNESFATITCRSTGPKEYKLVIAAFDDTHSAMLTEDTPELWYTIEHQQRLENELTIIPHKTPHSTAGGWGGAS